MADQAPVPNSLEQELAAVDHELQQALADLYPPFSQLIAAKLRECYPLVRAALVLTTGVGAPDNAQLQAQRIYLGAAVEMLHLALAVHSELLIPNNVENDQQRSILGSMILAGDYLLQPLGRIGRPHRFPNRRRNILGSIENRQRRASAPFARRWFRFIRREPGAICVGYSRRRDVVWPLWARSHGSGNLQRCVGPIAAIRGWRLCGIACIPNRHAFTATAATLA